MIKRFLNGVCWTWLAGVTVLYLYLCITEGVVSTLECSSLDEVGSFITAMASLVLITNKFVIPGMQRMEVFLAGIARKHKHRKMFTSYTQITE